MRGPGGRKLFSMRGLLVRFCPRLFAPLWRSLKSQQKAFGDMGRPDSPQSRGKTRNVARQTSGWKCRPSKPKMSPAKIESNSPKTHQNNGSLKNCPKSVERHYWFWRTPKRRGVGRRFPLEIPTLTWRLPSWVIRHTPTTKKRIFYMTTPR